MQLIQPHNRLLPINLISRPQIGLVDWWPPCPIPRGLFSRARVFSYSGLSFCSSIRAVPASDSPNGVLGQCLDRIARRLESTDRAVQIFLVDCRPPAYRPGTPGKASGLQYSLAIILVGFDKVFPVCLSIDCWRLSRSRSSGFTPC